MFFFSQPSCPAARLSIFLQTGLALAVGERRLKLEHRDLHLGNVLITHDGRDCTHIPPPSYINGVKYQPLGGPSAQIIDFACARIQRGKVNLNKTNFPFWLRRWLKFICWYDWKMWKSGEWEQCRGSNVLHDAKYYTVSELPRIFWAVIVTADSVFGFTEISGLIIIREQTPIGWVFLLSGFWILKRAQDVIYTATLTWMVVGKIWFDYWPVPNLRLILCSRPEMLSIFYWCEKYMCHFNTTVIFISLENLRENTGLLIDINSLEIVIEQCSCQSLAFAFLLIRILLDCAGCSFHVRERGLPS